MTKEEFFNEATKIDNELDDLKQKKFDSLLDFFWESNGIKTGDIVSDGERIIEIIPNLKKGSIYLDYDGLCIIGRLLNKDLTHHPYQGNYLIRIDNLKKYNKESKEWEVVTNG